MHISSLPHVLVLILMSHMRNQDFKTLQALAVHAGHGIIARNHTFAGFTTAQTCRPYGPQLLSG